MWLAEALSYFTCRGFKYNYLVMCLSKLGLRGGGGGIHLGSEMSGWEMKQNRIEQNKCV